MSAVIAKIAKKVIGKVSDAMTEEMVEPIYKLIMTLLQLTDIDNQPEVKTKLFYGRILDHETYEKEQYICVGFRIVEPLPLEERIKRLQQILAQKKKT